MESDLAKEWNKIHSQYISSYDDWLEPYQALLLKENKIKIVELGCGRAYTSIYLKEKGYSNVIACDFSDVVIEKLKEEQPELQTMLFDMTVNLPFDNNSIDIIIADLCIHYFNEKETQRLIMEINRVLKPDGYLVGRVNSTKDIEHGANCGEKIEENFYFINSMYKRFFGKEDFEKFFSEFRKIDLQEKRMDRYEKTKHLWSFLYQKKA